MVNFMCSLYDRKENEEDQNMLELKAGTGFMRTLSEEIDFFEKKGYVENLSATFSHFECRSGRYKIFPFDLVVDKILRFDNSSDPNDQSIMYAISCPRLGIKGIYIEAYGCNQIEFSHAMIERFKNHH